MAKLTMSGPVADVEITEDYDDEDTPIVLTCISHGLKSELSASIPAWGGCGETARVATYGEAVNVANIHAENGAALS